MSALAQIPDIEQLSGELEEIATSSSNAETPLEPQSIFPIEITVTYPLFSDGSSQSALKAGDQFKVHIDTANIFIHDATVDLSELGLPSDTVLSGLLGEMSTEVLTLPGDISDGTKAITVRATNAFGSDVTESVGIAIDSTRPSGNLQATFVRTDDLSGTWSAHLAGSFSGTGSESLIIKAFTIGLNENGVRLGTSSVDVDSLITLHSPIRTEVVIPTPDISWPRIVFGITLLDEAGNQADIVSSPFPLIELHPVLINHAINGSIVTASNYIPGAIPGGIGIPHTLINTIPAGDYFAVVFFEGLAGCPSSNYAINAFRADTYWGYGVRGPNGGFSKAYGTPSGGCMQRFEVNPARDGDWLWGALDPTNTASAIADSEGIPAFAICATEAVCSLIVPHARIESNPSTPPAVTGVSNVMFLPGIKGSSLYEENPVCVIVSILCDIPLWLPLSDLSAPELYMNEDGSSRRAVYAKDEDILAHAYGRPLYNAFINDMDARATDGDWEWKAIAYDWRRSLGDIVQNGTQQEERVYFEDTTNTPYILDHLRRLASSSATGKVTLVTHSNGGLVAKKLMREIGDTETSRLIDAVILVGVPQSGAPRAIASLLFGDSESLPGIGVLPELFMSAAHARTFGLLAPMAYHLLPSPAYTEAVQDPNHPLITFGEGLLLSSARAVFGERISSFAELREFLIGADGRTVPEEEDLRSPAVVKPSLISYAVQEHALLDSWLPPAGVVVYEIAGWGADTLSGIELFERELPARTGTSTQLLHRPQFVEDGDGTVPIPSAHLLPESSQAHRYWANLPLLSADQQRYSHATLFEIPEVRELVQNILERKPVLPSHISTEAPQTQNPTKKLLFVLHTPANLSVMNSARKKTHVTAHGTGNNDISGSQSGNIGAMQYVLVPGNDTYTVQVDESESESFSLDIQELVEGVVIASSTLTRLITDPSTVFTFTITNGIDGLSSLEESVSPSESKTSQAVTRRIKEIANQVVQGVEMPITAKLSEFLADTNAPETPQERTVQAPKRFAWSTASAEEVLAGDISQTANSESFFSRMRALISDLWNALKAFLARMRN